MEKAEIVIVPTARGLGAHEFVPPEQCLGPAPLRKLVRLGLCGYHVPHATRYLASGVGGSPQPLTGQGLVTTYR